MTITVERFADYRHARALAGTTFFERNDELTGTLMRGQHPNMHRPDSANGIVLLCMDIDHEGFARVEVEPSRTLGFDTLATAELALTHLRVVCDRHAPSLPLKRGSEHEPQPRTHRRPDRPLRG